MPLQINDIFMGQRSVQDEKFYLAGRTNYSNQVLGTAFTPNDTTDKLLLGFAVGGDSTYGTGTHGSYKDPGNNTDIFLNKTGRFDLDFMISFHENGTGTYTPKEGLIHFNLRGGGVVLNDLKRMPFYLNRYNNDTYINVHYRNIYIEKDQAISLAASGAFGDFSGLTVDARIEFSIRETETLYGV